MGKQQFSLNQTHKHTFNGILKVFFFSFFSITGSVVLCSSTVELDEVSFAKPSTSELPLLSSEELLELASSDTLADETVEFSTVRFFLGTSTHSVISMTASARSRERIPLLLREKCRLALIGDDRFRDEYLN